MLKESGTKVMSPAGVFAVVAMFVGDKVITDPMMSFFDARSVLHVELECSDPDQQQQTDQ